MKPLIGVSCNQRSNPGRIVLRNEYLAVIEENDGLPVVVPVNPDPRILEETLSRCDGLLLTGGGDIHPAFYGKPEDCVIRGGDWRRDCYEIILTDFALRVNMPVLAICRGMQILNIYLNGTLYRDLRLEFPEAEAHETETVGARCFHPVKILRGTKLYRILGEEEVTVNSSHHQAVNKLGDSLITSGLSPSGIVEAVESVTDRWVIGVQWHPERLTGVRAMPGLIREFVKAAGRKPF